MSMWDERYGSSEYHFGTEPNAFLRAHVGALPPTGRVLVVADGEGRNGVFLAQQGFDVVTFDASAVGVDKARRLAADRGVTIDARIGDVDTWDWGAETYEGAVAIFVQFSPPESRRAVWAGIARALTPGGVLLLQGYRVEQLAYGTGGPPVAEHLYTEDLIRAELGAAGLDIDHLVAHDDVVTEGRGHDGMSALLDVVAHRRVD